MKATEIKDIADIENLFAVLTINETQTLGWVFHGWVFHGWFNQLDQATSMAEKLSKKSNVSKSFVMKRVSEFSQPEVTPSQLMADAINLYGRATILNTEVELFDIRLHVLIASLLPPTDVVEAARSLMSFDYNYMEPPVDLVRTVCEWVLSTNSTKQ